MPEKQAKVLQLMRKRCANLPTRGAKVVRFNLGFLGFLDIAVFNIGVGTIKHPVLSHVKY